MLDAALLSGLGMEIYMPENYFVTQLSSTFWHQNCFDETAAAVKLERNNDISRLDFIMYSHSCEVTPCQYMYNTVNRTAFAENPGLSQAFFPETTVNSGKINP